MSDPRSPRQHNAAPRQKNSCTARPCKKLYFRVRLADIGLERPGQTRKVFVQLLLPEGRKSRACGGLPIKADLLSLYC